jgi:hypothetical protein
MNHDFFVAGDFVAVAGGAGDFVVVAGGLGGAFGVPWCNTASHFPSRFTQRVLWYSVSGFCPGKCATYVTIDASLLTFTVFQSLNDDLEKSNLCASLTEAARS